MSGNRNIEMLFPLVARALKNGGTVTPEQIQAAVDQYLKENPVSGMTEEQVEQLNQATEDILTKVDIAQGVENAGKVLGIDSDGNVTPVEGTGGGSGGTTNYNDLTNKPTINGVTLEGNKTAEDLKISGMTAEQEEQLNQNTQDIQGKVSKDQGTLNAGKVLGIGADGMVTPMDPLAGKHILFAGDSLVSGLGWKGGFANCLQEDHPTAIITNVAAAGALLTYAPDRPWIAQQLQKNIAGKDILIFDGGFNDIISGKVMGTVPDDIAFNNNPATVADAFAAWLWLAREINPTMDIFYIIPCMYRNTQTGGTNTSVLNELAEILKTICGYYSVGVIDLRFNGRVPLYAPLGGTMNPYMYDSLHPNELGYRKLAPFIDHEICKRY